MSNHPGVTNAMLAGDAGENHHHDIHAGLPLSRNDLQTRSMTSKEVYGNAFDEPPATEADENTLMYHNDASMDDQYMYTPRNMDVYGDSIWSDIGYTAQPQEMLEGGAEMFFNGARPSTAEVSKFLPSPESSIDTSALPKAEFWQASQVIEPNSPPPNVPPISPEHQTQRNAKDKGRKRRKISSQVTERPPPKHGGCTSPPSPKKMISNGSTKDGLLTTAPPPSLQSSRSANMTPTKPTKPNRRTYNSKASSVTDMSTNGNNLVDPDLTSQRERNRVAASKCRAKSKKNIEELEESNRLVTEQRQFLTTWAASLKDEIITLKAEVLRHGDCDCELIQSYIKNMAKKVGQLGEGEAPTSPSTT